jgi:hypothetical protein
MNQIVARLSEPSTWAGIGLIVNTLGPVLFPNQWGSIHAIITTLIAGGIAVAAPEKGSVPPPKS